jgi:hypothetical protein
MHTVKPSIDLNSNPLADWLGEAIALVQRVNAKLRKDPISTSGHVERAGRLVLTDSRCLSLAGFPDETES